MVNAKLGATWRENKKNIDKDFVEDSLSRLKAP